MPKGGIRRRQVYRLMRPARECRQLAILGVGLMGASIGAAHKRAFPDTVIVGSSPSAHDGRIARERGYIDLFTQKNADAVLGADRVVIASPPSTISSVWKDIAPLTKGVPVTDISSVKVPIFLQFEREMRHNFPFYTSSHPMAGREESGAQGARANLFDGTSTFLVPFHQQESVPGDDWDSFWMALGCRSIYTVPPGEHDRILSLISHLPHVLSYAVLEMMNEARLRGDLPHLNWEEQKGGALSDMTRISHSHPELWGEILNSNKTSLADDLDGIIRILTAWKTTLKTGSAHQIAQSIESVQNLHQQNKKLPIKEKKDTDADS